MPEPTRAEMLAMLESAHQWQVKRRRGNPDIDLEQFDKCRVCGLNRYHAVTPSIARDVYTFFEHASMQAIGISEAVLLTCKRTNKRELTRMARALMRNATRGVK